MRLNQDKFKEIWQDKIKAKCEKNGGDGAFEKLMVGTTKQKKNK